MFGGSFVVSPVKKLQNGWERYEPSMVIDSRAAQFMYLDPTTPEAALAHFYASLIRRDDAYREVVPGRWDRPKILSRKIDKLTTWTFLQVTFLGRKVRRRKTWVRIRAKVLIDGEVREHLDEAKLKPNPDADGEWWVWRPPT